MEPNSSAAHCKVGSEARDKNHNSQNSHPPGFLRFNPLMIGAPNINKKTNPNEYISSIPNRTFEKQTRAIPHIQKSWQPRLINHCGWKQGDNLDKAADRKRHRCPGRKVEVRALRLREPLKVIMRCKIISQRNHLTKVGQRDQSRDTYINKGFASPPVPGSIGSVVLLTNKGSLPASHSYPSEHCQSGRPPASERISVRIDKTSSVLTKPVSLSQSFLKRLLGFWNIYKTHCHWPSQIYFRLCFTLRQFCQSSSMNTIM